MAAAPFGVPFFMYAWSMVFASSLEQKPREQNEHDDNHPDDEGGVDFIEKCACLGEWCEQRGHEVVSALG